MNTINSLKDSENVFSGLFVRKRESTSAAAYFACFLTNSMNTSVGVQNRVAIRRTIDSERDTIEEMTRFC